MYLPNTYKPNKFYWNIYELQCWLEYDSHKINNYKNMEFVCFLTQELYLIPYIYWEKYDRMKVPW